MPQPQHGLALRGGVIDAQWSIRAAAAHKQRLSASATLRPPQPMDAVPPLASAWQPRSTHGAPAHAAALADLAKQVAALALLADSKPGKHVHIHSLEGGVEGARQLSGCGGNGCCAFPRAGRAKTRHCPTCSPVAERCQEFGKPKFFTLDTRLTMGPGGIASWGGRGSIAVLCKDS